MAQKFFRRLRRGSLTANQHTLRPRARPLSLDTAPQLLYAQVVSSPLVDIDAPAVPEAPHLVRSGAFVFPPGLRLNLPFYLFHRFFEPGNPIRLFLHLQRYGRAAHYRILWHHVVLLNHPSDIREVLIDKAASFGKDRTQKRMKILLGEGLITSDGPTHKRARRIAAPAFHRQRIHRYAGQIVALSAALADDWQPGRTLDLNAEMMRLALQITARTLFDTEVTPEIHLINDQVNAVMDIYYQLVAMPRAELFLDWPIPFMRRFRKAKASLDRVVDAMILARRAELDRTPANSQPRADLLSMLLDARDEGSEGGGPLDEASTGDGLRLTAEELRDQVLTLFLASYETVANALSWTWLLLARNPQAESRLHAELDRVLAGRLPTLDDLPQLEYTAMVLAESMRLYPPAWAMGREALEDVLHRPLSPAQRNHGPLQPVHRPARSPLVPRPRGIPPRAPHPTGQSRPAPLRLLPLRRRRPSVHRRVLRLDGSHSRPRLHRPALAPPARAQPGHRTPTQDHPPPQTRHSRHPHPTCRPIRGSRAVGAPVVGPALQRRESETINPSKLP